MFFEEPVAGDGDSSRKKDEDSRVRCHRYPKILRLRALEGRGEEVERRERMRK
jgi:hypothetical protein